MNKDGQKGIDQVNAMIEAATKAAQVDPDFDPGRFFELAQASKVAGPALSMGFLSRVPVFAQDMGAGATGNAVAMAFRAFVLEAVGSAGGKKYLQERDRLGIRQGGKLVDSELFGSDPDQWVLKHLMPALKRDGVDMDNDTQIAAAVGKLSGNTTATGLMTRIITQREQIERWLGLMDKAIGTDKAGDVRFEDPFVGFEAFKKSLENLSAALTPIDAINAGLNTLADGVNALARAGQENPALTALGIGVVGAAGVGAGKYVGSKLMDAFGLRSAAAELTVAARMLQGAAGGDIAGDLPGGGKKGGWLGKLTAALGIAGLAGATSATLNLGQSEYFMTEWERQRNRYIRSQIKGRLGGGHAAEHERDSTNNWSPGASLGIRSLAEREHSIERLIDSLDRYMNNMSADQNNFGHDPSTISAGVDAWKARKAGRSKYGGLGGMTDDEMDRNIALVGEMKAKGAEIQEALSVEATPSINLGPLQQAVSLAQQFLNLMKQANAAAANANANAQMRRNMADYGVAP